MKKNCDTCRYNPEVWLCTEHALKENKSKFNCNGYESDVKTLESELEQCKEALESEKAIRIKYQDIVYKVCNVVDYFNPKESRITIDAVVDKVKEMILNTYIIKPKEDEDNGSVKTLRLSSQ